MIRYHNSIIYIFISSILFGQGEFNINSLVNEDNIYKIKGQSDLVTGTVFTILENKKIRMGRLSNGKKNGIWTEWHPNERRLQETYKKGLLDGPVSFFYKNGQKEWRYTYNNGILEGNHTKWHKNGKRAVDGFFESGSPVGVWCWRNKDGKIIKKEIFKKRKKGILNGYNEYVDKELIPQ